MQAIFTNSSFIFWSAIVLMSVVPTIAHFWWKIRQAEIEATLKRDMLDRGLSVEEIERILAAGMGESAKKQYHQSAAAKAKAGAAESIR